MPRHSTQEQRMAELQHLMALPPQGLLQLAGDEIENRWARAPALKTVREAEHSGRGVDSALRLAYETLIELDAGVDEEGMRMIVALEKRLSKRGRRANPPLSEHMASDDLAMIAHHLGPRLAADPSEGAEFALAVVDACIDGLVAKKPVGEYAPATGFEQHLMQARRHLVSAVEGAHPRQRHNPRHR